MASAPPSESWLESEVPELLLGRIAHRLFPNHLERFATQVIGLGEARYFHVIDGAANSWQRCFWVLRAWYKATIRKMKELCIILQEAERLGFVERGTYNDLLGGRVLDPSYLVKCQNGQYPDYASMVASWYTDPTWENMLLFPWMKEESLELSKVYAALEMDSSLRSGKAMQLKDYRDLFKDRKPEATRILVKGDPGIGKTTFIHKLAYDWAMGSLDLFDVVFVLKLRLIDATQLVKSVVKMQISPLEDNNTNEDLLEEYLKSGRDRVLLVLDGLDEINLKDFPEIENILAGKSYRRCCILATTRPHIARELKSSMTSLAHLKGFSRAKAEQFISHIIEDQTKRKKFFAQLDRRKMSEMHKVPLIVQALALLFLEDEELPETYTATYDQLVFFLTRTFEEKIQSLTEEEIQAAMNEINELAFRGLTRDDKQLVFKRNEVKNQNVFNMGILSGEKAGSGFKPTTVLQFPHKTIQENCAANHIVMKLEARDRSCLEAVIQRFHKTAETEISQSRSKKFQAKQEQTEQLGGEEHTQTRILNRALQNFMGILSSLPNRNAAVIDILNTLTEVGAFDEELDVTNMWDEFTGYPLVAQLPEDEQSALFEFIVYELLCETTPQWRAQQRRWVEGLETADDEILTTYFLGLQVVVTWIQNGPDMAKQKLKEMAAVFAASGSLPAQSVAQDFIHVWEHLESYKTLFRFIAGKLSEESLHDFLFEIATLAIQHSFDKVTGGVLPFQLLQSFMEDLRKESNTESDPSSLSLPLIHLDARNNAYHLQSSKQPCNFAAVKISGDAEDSSNGFIQRLIKQLAGQTNFYIVEIEDISRGSLSPDICRDFARMLFQSHIVSMELRNVDPILIRKLLNDLPMSTRRLSISRSPSGISYRLPPVVNLACLYLENDTNNLKGLTESRFPNLKRLSMINAYWWSRDDVLALQGSLKGGTMPTLEELQIRFAQLRGYGEEIADILTHSTLKDVELIGAGLRLDDGKVVLKYIQDGRLDHIINLNIENNDDLGPMAEELKGACELHEIRLKVSAAKDTAPGALPFGLENLLLGNSAAGGAQNLDFAALAANFAPLLMSGNSGGTSASHSRQENSASRQAPNIGNVLSSVLGAVSTPNAQSTAASSRQESTVPSRAVNIGNILSSVLGAVSTPNAQPTQSADDSSRQGGSAASRVTPNFGNILSTVLETANTPDASPTQSFGNILSAFLPPPAPSNHNHVQPGSTHNTSQQPTYMEDDLD